MTYGEERPLVERKKIELPFIVCFPGPTNRPAEDMIVAIFLLVIGSAVAKVDFKHHNNTEMAEELQKIHNACPDISRLYTLSETRLDTLIIDEYVIQL